MNDRAIMIPAGDGTWSTLAGTVTFCGVEYRVLFNRTGPTASLQRVTPHGSGGSAGSAGSPGTITPLQFVCCDCNVITFAAGGLPICTGTPVCGGPCANTAVIRIAWVPCAYSGPGWYCARSCGSSGAGTPILLSDTTASDSTIEILSGPYDTDLQAALACGEQTPHGISCGDLGGQIAVGQMVTGGIGGGVGIFGKFFHAAVTPGVTYHLRIYGGGSTGNFVNVNGIFTQNADGSGTGGPELWPQFILPPSGNTPQPPPTCSVLTFTAPSGFKGICISLGMSVSGGTQTFAFQIVTTCP